jgi:hypothetical protein
MVATNGTHVTTELEGTVSRVNERGLLLEGEATWRNVSKFAGGIWLPDVSERVRLVLDSAGFIRKIEPLDAPAPSPSVDTSPAAPVSTAVSEPHAPADRDTRISRMACLNTATAILSSGGAPTDLAAALAVAEELERWVLLRPVRCPS